MKPDQTQAGIYESNTIANTGYEICFTPKTNDKFFITVKVAEVGSNT